MPSDLERELCRKARLHRHHRGRWCDFWTEHADEIRDACPEPAARRDLVDRLQCCVLSGISPEPVREIRA